MDYRFDLKAIKLISSRDLLRKWTTLKQEENARHVEESSYNSTYSLHFGSYRPIQAFKFERFKINVREGEAPTSIACNQHIPPFLLTPAKYTSRITS